MESPIKVAKETAEALAKRPDVLVAACASEYPEQSQLAIAALMFMIEAAIRRCMCRNFPKGD